MGRRRHLTRAQRIAIFERDGWICHLCGRKTRLCEPGAYNYHPDLAELDHVESLAGGGADQLSNCACACARCNRVKHAKRVEEVNERLRAARSPNPRSSAFWRPEHAD